MSSTSQRPVRGRRPRTRRAASALKDAEVRRRAGRARPAPARLPVVRPAPRHPRHRHRRLGRRRRPGRRRVPRRRRHPRGGRVRARTPRPRPRRPHEYRDDVDGRRPRPGPPAPAHLAPRPDVGHPDLAGPPGRPEDPRPDREGRRPRRPGARPPAAHRRGHPPRPHHRPGHRHAHARGARHPRGTRPADLGRDPAPPQPDRVRRHQRAPRHRRHDDPHPPLRPDLRHRRRPQDRRRPRPARRPQGQSPRASSPAPRRPSSTCTSTPTHPSAGPRSSAPPPSPRSATGSATPGSPSNPSSAPTAPTPVDAHDPPAWMRDLVILRDPRCVFPHCQRDARACDLDHTIPLRRHRPTRPDPTRQPRPAVPETPPRQDHRPLAIPPTTRRHLPMDRARHHRMITTTSATALTTSAPISSQAVRWRTPAPRATCSADPRRMPCAAIASSTRCRIRSSTNSG